MAALAPISVVMRQHTPAPTIRSLANSTLAKRSCQSASRNQLLIAGGIRFAECDALPLDPKQPNVRPFEMPGFGKEG
jgi:hypothetical protein